VLRVDNKSAIALINNLVLHGQSRHIEVKYHLVWESVENGRMKVEFIRGEQQLGDSDKASWQSQISRALH
jgi:hypothetical protein